MDMDSIQPQKRKGHNDANEFHELTRLPLGFALPVHRDAHVTCAPRRTLNRAGRLILSVS